ncbi:hypothetical protein HY837_04430 [archaeon]|nr:hypothetical protein [archaeon]
MNESPIIGKYECHFDSSSELDTDEGFFILEPGKGLEDALLFSTNEEETEETESEDLYDYSDDGNDFPKKFINALLIYKVVGFYNDEKKFVLHIAKKAIISFEKLYDEETGYDFIEATKNLLEKVAERKKNKKRHNPE